MGGERAAEIAEAAVERRAGAEAAFRERADRALRDRRAQRAVARLEGAKGAGEIDAGVDRRLQCDAVAVPGGEASASPRRSARVEPSPALVQRQHPAAGGAPLAGDAHRDAGGLVAKHDAGEGANAAAAGVEGRQAPDQVEEEVLTQVIEIGSAAAAPGARDARQRRLPRPAG